MRTWSRRVIGLVVVAILAVLSLPQFAGEGQEAEWPGVEGTSYRSPSFGYTLSWDEPWSVREAYAGPPDDGLILSNGTSDVMVIGTNAFGGDRDACLLGTVQLLSETWDDLRLAGDGSGSPATGEDDARAWATFAGTIADSGGNEHHYTVYAECRDFAPEPTTVTFIHSAPLEVYEPQVADREELLAAFQGAVWPGVEGTTYQSPSFGYTLSWDETWSVREAYAGPPDDGLILSNGTSDVMVIGTKAFAGEYRNCLRAAIDLLSGTWDDIRVASDNTGAPLAGEDDARAWAVLSATIADPESGLGQFLVYAECWGSAPEGTTVAILHTAPAADYEDQIEVREELLNSFEEAAGSGVD